MARKNGEEVPVYPLECRGIDDLPWLDLRALSRLSGFPISALHLQIGRDVYPWLEIGQKGRARRFDPAAALHVAIAGKLATGWSVSVTSASALALGIIEIARAHLDDPNLRIAIGARPQARQGQLPTQPQPIWRVSAGDPLPDDAIIINVGKIVAQLRETTLIVIEPEPQTDEAPKPASTPRRRA